MRTLAVAGLALFVAACTSGVVPSPDPTTPRATPTTPGANPTATTTATGTAVAETGTISGQVSYPAEDAPALIVYAFDVADESRYFSVDIKAWTADAENPTYTLSVPAGTYHVVAYVSDDIPNRDVGPGLYSEAVPCGLSAACGDHTLIEVTVAAGETRSGVDPTDWYHPPGTNFPARPR